MEIRAIDKIKSKITIIPVKKYCTKGYRKISHRKGHGVHSPFAYCLITQTIEEKAAYYKYEDIEVAYKKVKANLNESGKPSIKLQDLKVYKLLFRLVNRFKPSTILECGTSYGVSTVSLHCAMPSAKLITVEQNAIICSLADSVMPSVKFINTPYGEGVKQLFLAGISPDFIYIRNQVSLKDYEAIFSSLAPNLSDNVVIFVEGIRKNRDIYKNFCIFAAQDKIKIVMDLYDIAILITSPKLNRERYKASF